MGCQTSDKMALRAHAPISAHPAPCSHRPPRAGVRAGLHRPDRGNRRRQEHPGGRRRPARRRPRLRRPRPHRRRSRHRRSDLRHARRPRNDRPPRSLRAGAQPRVHRRRAGHHAPRSARRAAASSICTGSTSIRSCSIPQRTSTFSTSSRRSRDARHGGGSRIRGVAANPRRTRPAAVRGAREGITRGVPVVPDRRRSNASRRSRARTKSSLRHGSFWPTPTNCSGCASDAYDALYEGDTAALPALEHGVAQGRRISPRWTPDSRPTPRPAKR